jgi:hypothetical protein
MLLTAVFGVYLALLGLVAYDDLPYGKESYGKASAGKSLPGEGEFTLRA